LRTKDKKSVVKALPRRLKRAQMLVRKYIKPGESLADELIADRRRAARE